MQARSLYWDYEGGDSGTLHSVEPTKFCLEEISLKLFVNNSLDFAQKGLLLYFQLSKALYDYILKKSNEIVPS